MSQGRPAQLLAWVVRLAAASRATAAPAARSAVLPRGIPKFQISSNGGRGSALAGYLKKKAIIKLTYPWKAPI